MELRKKVKRPQRYEPERDDSSKEQTYIPPLNRPIFPTPFIEYNPILRPAAFPTLDQAQIALSGQSSAAEPSNTRSRQEATIDSIVERTSPQSDMAPLRASDQTEARTRNTSALAVEEENQEASNCHQNQVYATNLKLIQRFNQRTEHDWNMQEMETSDEEELQEETMLTRRKTPASGGSAPAWEDLTVAHRLEIVDTLAEHYRSRREVMQRLHLTQPQRRELVTQLAAKHQHEAREAERIAGFQHRLMQSLLDTAISSSSTLTQDVYGKLLEEHLYHSIGEENYSITNTKELVKAKAYMKSVGFAPSLVGHWVELSPFSPPLYVTPPFNSQAPCAQRQSEQQESVQQQNLPVRRRFGDREVLRGKGVRSLYSSTYVSVMQEDSEPSRSLEAPSTVSHQFSHDGHGISAPDKLEEPPRRKRRVLLVPGRTGKAEGR